MTQSRGNAADSAQDDGIGPNALVFHFGHEELVIQRRYQTLSIINDFLIGFWFLIGSFAFFSPAWENFGVWLFVLGSAELLIRPLIRLAHHIHFKRIPQGQSWDL